jgi:excisionase family DNA binding protein
MTESKNQKLAYTVEEACDVTGMTRTRIYKAIADATLVTFKAGRRRMVSAKALEAFIAKLERDGVKAAA